MTKEELIEFLKENLELSFDHPPSSVYPQIVLTLCGEEVSEISLWGLETS